MAKKSNQIPFEYTVIRSNRKTVTISVNPFKGVIVRAPYHYHEANMIKMLKCNEAKIIIELDKNRIKPQGFAEGDFIPYLGKPLKIVYKGHTSNKGPIIDNQSACLVVPLFPKEQDQMPLLIEEWFVGESVRVLSERMDTLMERLGIKPTKVSFRSQKTRWGSCSSKGSISLNWKLIFAPIEVIDYVIIHELCHLYHMNHSKLFWDKVMAFDPNYKERRLWLKKNASIINWPYSQR